MSGRDVEDRIDGVFAGGPEGFTAARDALVRELRAAGDREAAARVAALRRPTRRAAELNVLARERPREVAAVVAAAEALAVAQGRLVDGSGSADELREAAEAEARAVAAVSDDEAVRAAVRLAARSPVDRAGLVRGRLMRDPAPDPDAGLFAGG
ncbi:MAG: hypothetical protein AB1416_09615, partial [Actinomycetota bacterium]